MLQRKLLGDHPAHRDPEHVRALPSELVEQSCGVLSELSDRERLVDAVAAANAAVVVGDGLEVARELGAKRLAPGQMRPAHALDQQQRLARTAAVVKEAAAADSEMRHAPGRYPTAKSASWPGGVSCGVEVTGSSSTPSKPATRTPSRRTGRGGAYSRKSSSATAMIVTSS